MSLPNLFKLEKLKIRAYSVLQNENSKETLTLIDEFTVMFNPNSYSRSYGNVYQTQAATDGDQSKPKLSFQEQETLDLELIIDGTGVADFGIESILGIGTDTVTKQIDKLVKCCLDKDAESHHPNLAELDWGHLYFKGYMRTMNVTYTLFDQSGAPLRAKVNVSFIGAHLEKKEVHSADISRLHTVKMEDTMPLLAKKIYGSFDHYLDLARANDLDQFRRLRPGSQLVVPSVHDK
jgi:nucleoid-associated protein YgaU